MRNSDRGIVLVVDDSPETLRLLTDALEKAGMTVLVAREGEHALSIVAKVVPDVVLPTPSCRARTVLRPARKLKQNRALARCADHIHDRAQRHRAHHQGIGRAAGVDYVTKPIVPGELLARIRVHLANARMTHSARAALDAFGRFLWRQVIAGAYSGTPRRRQSCSGLRSRISTRKTKPLHHAATIQNWLHQCAAAQPGVEPLSINVNARNSPTRVRLMPIAQIGPTKLSCCVPLKAESKTTTNYSSKNSR